MEDSKQESKPVDKDKIKAIISNQLALSEDEDSQYAEKRTQALEYIQSEMKDVPAEKGRSSVVSRDVADTIGWIMPSIMRVFATTDQMAVVDPVTPADEGFAKAATDGLNHWFLKENDGYKVVYNATYDALSMSNAIVKVWYDDTPEYKTDFYDGLTDDQLALLEADESVEILAHTPSMKSEVIDGQKVQYKCHEVKTRHVKEKGRIKVDVVPREDYGQDANATNPGNATFQYQKVEKTRSELVEMGFDQKEVYAISKSGEEKQEAFSRSSDTQYDNETTDDSTEVIDLYECYLMVDVDQDGIAENVRAFYAGGKGGGVVLDWEVWEDGQVFFDIPCSPIPHRFEGESIFDVTKDIQDIKTVLQRQALDNLYAANIPQRQAEVNSIVNPDDLFSSDFGAVIWRKAGTAPVESMITPNVAGDAFGAINYFDQVVQRRTGVGRQTMALNADTLNNQTATASNNEKDAAYSKIEQIARNMAELGWKPVFEAGLKLMTKHQDKAKTIRLRGEWIEIDPRHWNADMQVTINVGLGTGTRERDLVMLQQVFQQQLLLASQLKENGMIEKSIEMVPMIFNTAQKMAESSGLRSPEQYIPEFKDEDMQAAMKVAQEARSKPSPEQQKLQAEMAMKEKDMQLQMKMKEVDAQVQNNKERAQAEADIVVDEKRRESDMIIAKQQIEYQQERDALQTKLKEMEIKSKREIELLKLGLKDQPEVGSIVTREDERNMAFSQSLEGMAAMMQELVTRMEAPKRLIKDENGDIIGSEPVRGALN